MVTQDISSLSNWFESYLNSGVELTPRMVGHLLDVIDDIEIKVTALEQGPCIQAVHLTVMRPVEKGLWGRIRALIGGAS